MRRICVFCGSSFGNRPQYREAAATLGGLLASRGYTLVYGGAGVGLMGALAGAALAANGEVIGVIPRALERKEIAHTGLTKLYVVESMHARKALMENLSDAFILLPGGFGSWDEFCEIVTWGQIGIHAKPCGILNVAGYYDSLLVQFGHAVEEGFVRHAQAATITVESGAESLLSKLESRLLTRAVP